MHSVAHEKASSHVASSPTPSPLAIWWMAARPKTLVAAVVPVAIGTVMAWEAGGLHLPSALWALGAACLVQIGTNFHNDYLDYEKGADTEARVGPTRVTQAGLVSPSTMRRATYLTLGAALACGLALVERGGWPVLAIGLVSIGMGVLYTATRFSLAYLGLADLAVLVFFGPVAVAGTYYVQALSVNALVIAAGLGPGLLSTAILLVNNIRDVEEDRRADKRTLVVRLGRPAGVALWVTCVAGAALLPVALFLITGMHPWSMATLVVCPLAWPTFRTLRNSRDPEQLNPMLGATARLLLVYGLAFSIGWAL